MYKTSVFVVTAQLQEEAVTRSINIKHHPPVLFTTSKYPSYNVISFNHDIDKLGKWKFEENKLSEKLQRRLSYIEAEWLKFISYVPIWPTMISVCLFVW